MARYAAKTKVPVAQSRDEIEKTLDRFGATGFAYGYDENRASVMFTMQGRKVRYSIDVPANPQAQRQRWRALLLVIKAKLEAVVGEISEFEEEFFAHIVMPGGRTVYEMAREQVRIAYDGGHVSHKLLPDYSDE